MQFHRKIKNHVVRHKELYIGLGVGAAVGASVVALKRTDVFIKNSNENTALLIWKPVQELNVHIEALGDPGDIIQDVASGTIYASQGQAARELGLNRPDITKHLAGKKDSVKGHTFVRLGKAHVSE